MTKAVVVGGHGFIGAEVVRALLTAGAEVTTFDRSATPARADALFGRGAVRAAAGDVADPEALRRALAGADEVYHLAGALGTTELDACIPDAVAANVTGTVNVCEAAARAGVGTVFLASKPDVWLNAYTVTKRAAEQLAELYAARGAFRLRTLRYFNAYGPRQCLGPVRKIVPAFAAAALRGRPVEVYGDGEQTVDMVYAPDLGRLTVAFARSAHDGPPADCGRGVALTVNEVARAVNACVGSGAGLRHLPMRPGETPGTRLVADTAALRRAVGPLAFAPWEASLAETVAWYAALAPQALDAVPPAGAAFAPAAVAPEAFGPDAFGPPAAGAVAA